jgi:hypothetical protein
MGTSNRRRAGLREEIRRQDAGPVRTTRDARIGIATRATAEKVEWAWKIEMIEQFNPTWKDLADGLMG